MRGGEALRNQVQGVQQVERMRKVLEESLALFGIEFLLRNRR